MQSQSQYWLNVAKNKQKANTVPKLYERIAKLENLINNGLLPYDTRFVVDDTLKQTICFHLTKEIDEYSGTRKLAKGQEQSLDDVIVNTRTWWNRKKSSVLGPHLFSVICFYVLHHFITTQLKHKQISPTQRLVLFIDIFTSFMDETIKFPRTRAKSLIVQRCFLNNGDFKHMCARFIAIFGDQNIRWNCYLPSTGCHMVDGKKITKYIKKKDRTEVLCDEFYACLKKIKDKYMYHDTVNNIDHAMQEWNDYLTKSTPKQYALAYCAYEVAPKNAISEVSSTDSLEHCSQKPPSYRGRKRQFQSMNGFGCNFTNARDTNKRNENDHESLSTGNKELCAIRRLEEHIKEMKALMNHNKNDPMISSNDLDSLIPFELMYESDADTTYNVI